MDADVLRPQPGPQEAFLASSADIVIYGGAAFGGKTFALLLEPLRHIDNPQFGGVIFRRTTKQVKSEGGLWDTAEEIYPDMGAEPNYSGLFWKFPSGAKITFAHMEHEKNKHDWQGSQIPFIGFDELTHFSESMFWYMLSRNRSGSGVAGYVRATTNPDPDSWVADLIDWWIGEDGYAIPERSGTVRWFVRYHNELVWADSAEELIEQYPQLTPKSLTFISASYSDNKIGLEKDPAYLANLDALPRVEREQLKLGNWKIRRAVGDYFKPEWFDVVERAPDDCVWARYWDRASTEPNPQNKDPDWTAGVKLGKSKSTGFYYIENVARDRRRPAGVLRLIKGCAQYDGVDCAVVLEVDPAQAGQAEFDWYVRELSGFRVHGVKPGADKETRARPASSAAENYMIKLVRGAWNRPFLDELESFPAGKKDDQVDALSGAFNWLESKNTMPPAQGSVGDDGKEPYKPEAKRKFLGRLFRGR